MLELFRSDSSGWRQKAAYEKRCATLAERYADKINTIEVTNEMEWMQGTTAFYNEPDYIEWCFNTARKYITTWIFTASSLNHSK